MPNNLSTLFPLFSENLPVENYEFAPPPPRKRFFVPKLSFRLLTRRIYLEMLKAIRGYGELEAIAPNTDKEVIKNLRNQMEILSLAMLNIYGQTAEHNKVPFFAGGGINLSREYQTALGQMYDRVFHIHNLVFELIGKSPSTEISNALIIVYTNLKSQLRTLNELKNALGTF